MCVPVCMYVCILAYMICMSAYTYACTVDTSMYVYMYTGICTGYLSSQSYHFVICSNWTVTCCPHLHQVGGSMLRGVSARPSGLMNLRFRV